MTIQKRIKSADIEKGVENLVDGFETFMEPLEELDELLKIFTEENENGVDENEDE